MIDLSSFTGLDPLVLLLLAFIGTMSVIGTIIVILGLLIREFIKRRKGEVEDTTGDREVLLKQIDKNAEVNTALIEQIKLSTIENGRLRETLQGSTDVLQRLTEALLNSSQTQSTAIATVMEVANVNKKGIEENTKTITGLSTNLDKRLGDMDTARGSISMALRETESKLTEKIEAAQERLTDQLKSIMHLVTDIKVTTTNLSTTEKVSAVEVKLDDLLKQLAELKILVTPKQSNLVTDELKEKTDE